MKELIVSHFVKKLIPAAIGAAVLYVATNHPDIYAQICTGQ